MAAAVEVMAAAGAVHTSAAAAAVAAPISAVPASAELISVARASAAGLGYRGLRLGPVSGLTARLRSTAVRTGPPAAGQR